MYGDPKRLTRAKMAGALPSLAKPKRVRAVVYNEEFAADKTLLKKKKVRKKFFFSFLVLRLPSKNNSVNDMCASLDTC
jgi:hypothetical protein